MPSDIMTIADKLFSTFNGKEGSKFKSYEILEMVVTRYPDTNKNSILPADYCYNKTNRGNKFRFPYPLFEWHEDGIYLYIGPNFQYEGLAYWKGSVISEWKSGAYKQLKSFDAIKI